MKNYIKYFVICLIVVLVFGGVALLFRNNSNNNSSSVSNSDMVCDYSNDVYFALGDSITYGSNPENGLAQMTYHYPRLVSETLGMKGYVNYGQPGASATFVNGQSVTSIVENVKNIGSSGTVVSLMCGRNDYRSSKEIGNIDDIVDTTFYGALNIICSTIKNKMPNAFIFLMTPFKDYMNKSTSCFSPNALGYVMSDYANAIMSIGEKYNIPVLDMYTFGNFELEMGLSNSDGTHPTQNFITNYTAPQIAQFIKDNYKK